MKALGILIILLIFSCSHKKNNLNQLKVLTEIEKFGKDYYINEVNDIQFSDSSYYIVDSKINSLFLLNSDFKYITSIGRKGKGPEEFISMNAVTVTSNKFYISDAQQNCLMCYDKDRYNLLGKITFPKNLFLNYGDFYIDDNGNVSITYISKESSKIGMYNISSGEFHPFNIEIQNPKDTKLYRFIGNLEENFIAIIPRYSNKISFFSNQNYTKLGEISIVLPKESMIQWENLIKKGKHTPLIVDGFLRGKCLYLLYQDFANSSRALAQVKLSSNFEVIDILFFSFPKSNGDECINVSNNTIVTFSRAKNSIQKYDHLFR
ncbi:MAG: BF3164 family lipoprotein [Prolixibacteraceae bacterium]|jgi:hypothetical protein